MANSFQMVLTCSILCCGARAPGQTAVRRDAPTSLPATAPALTAHMPKLAVFAPERMKFSYPGDFVQGNFEAVQGDSKKFFMDAVVLLEGTIAQSIGTSQIPTDDSVAKISIHRLSRDFVAAVFQPLLRRESLITIGHQDVYKLPAFPGPFGDRAYCYLMLRSSGEAVLFLGTKFRRGSAENSMETHYDWVIERIVATSSFEDK